MQLESHATPPPRETPQQRYANLHRAIERGLDSDEIWRELADVSLRLGHTDEAVRCTRRIKNDTLRLAMQSRFERLGYPTGAPTAAEASSSEVPAASDAGPAAEEHTSHHSLRDHVVDAFQYLLHQHMPSLVLVTTLAFPLVIGAGGFLTAGGSWFLLAGIAALPGLCVLGLVGAMARQILLASAAGDGDVPHVPSFWVLVEDARRFFADLGLVLATLVGPALVAAWLGTPWTTTLPGLLIGAFFAPMAWILRHLQGDLEALSPVRLVRAVARTGISYAGVAGVVLVMFLPAAIAAQVAFRSPLWVQITIVGPLSVLPLFVSARLLGTWTDTRRQLLVRVVKDAAAKPATADDGPAPRLPKRPAALEHFRAPVAAAPTAARQTPRATPPARPAAPRAAVPAPAPAARAASRPAAAQPAATRTTAPSNPQRVAPARAADRPTARQSVQPTSDASAGTKRTTTPATPAAPAKPAKPATPAAPAAQPARAIEGRAPARNDDLPDLRHMPGATVVSGRDRQRQGAAARRP